MTVRTEKLVVAALIERDGWFLLSRRRADQSFPLCWEFPGGKVEAGEAPVAALGREIREELGCEVRVGGLFEEVRHAYAGFDLRMLVFACEIASGAPSAVAVAEVAWVEATRLPSLDLPPADRPLAQRLASRSHPAPMPPGSRPRD